ncbi:MAG: ABC transporter ATP-binding protein [Lachnospiraceae bacterium]
MNNNKRILLRISTYLLRYKWWLLLAIICSLVSNIFSLLGPMLSGYAIKVIELGAGRVDLGRVWRYAGWMIVVYGISSILSYLLSMIMVHVSRHIAFEMRQDMFFHLMDLPIRYFDQNAAGDIISKVSYDIDTVNASLSNDVVSVFSSIVTVVGSFVMMLVISPKLVLVFVVTVPMAIFFTKKLAGIVRPLFRARSGKLGQLNGYIEEMMWGQKTLKAYDQQPNAIRKFAKQNTDAVDAYYKADYMGCMVGPTVNLISNISISLVTVFGAILYMGGSMLIGDISSFVQYSRKFSGPINEAANIMSEFQSAFAAAERVFRLIDEVPEASDSEKAEILEDIYGNVKLEHVKFGYVPEKTILHDVNVNAAAGKLIAIVGPTGAGKTTLVNLLMRFYDVDSGKISIDGNNIYNFTRDSIRRSYAMVLQDTWLFYGTIAENIAYGNDNISREQIIQAAKMAHIHDYIMNLPNGYDTILSDNGTNISKGQKQLITIARAMLLDAKMLILDEATSNVDTRTEQLIQEAMNELMKNKTCFVIAHRLSTIQNADTILVVKDGDIVEQGTHESLMQQQGFYYELYRAQYQ